MRKVAIVGVGLTRTGRRADISHQELAWEAVRAALDDAKISIDEIEAVVHGCMDNFDGISSPERFDSPALGCGRGFGKPLIKISTGGTTGISTALAAYYHVASGLYDVVLAFAIQKVSENVEAQQVLNTAIEPILERVFGMGAIHAAALQQIRYAAIYKKNIEDYLAEVAIKNRQDAIRNPYAHLRLNLTLKDYYNSPYMVWPVRLLDCCPSSDGAVAIIFASEDKARKITDNPAWVNAVEYISDTYYWSQKTIEFWDNLAILARRLYRKAKIENPLKEIHMAELYNAFTIQEIMEYEAFGFADKGMGWKLLEEGITKFYGSLPVCPSGGVLATNPIAATGLIRVAEAALQVMGKAGQRQVPNVVNALAHAWGGALQFHGAMILSREKI
jgi:acetyl-CoA C-acetyltransferase